jgi:hydrogenase-4 component E
MPHLLLATAGLFDIGMFLLTVFMHTTRKTAQLLTLYMIQSFLVASFFAVTAISQGGSYLLIVAALTFLIKVIAVPLLFSRLMRRLGARFSSDTYLNTSWTLAVLFALSLFSFSALHTLPGAQFGEVSPILAYAPLHLAGILAALFLAVNRKEAFSQIIALLALENWVVFVAALAGFHQTLAVELAVTLEIIVLIVIAATFMVMVFERFGSLDVSKMTHLSERDEQ